MTGSPKGLFAYREQKVPKEYLTYDLVSVRLHGLDSFPHISCHCPSQLSNNPKERRSFTLNLISSEVLLHGTLLKVKEISKAPYRFAVGCWWFCWFRGRRTSFADCRAHCNTIHVAVKAWLGIDRAKLVGSIAKLGSDEENPVHPNGVSTLK